MAIHIVQLSAPHVIKMMMASIRQKLLDIASAGKLISNSIFHLTIERIISFETKGHQCCLAPGLLQVKPSPTYMILINVLPLSRIHLDILISGPVPGVASSCATLNI